MPKWPDHVGKSLEKHLHLPGKRVRRLTFNANRADHVPRQIKDGNNDLRPCCTKRRKVTGISSDVSDVDRLTAGNRRTSQPLGDRERGILRSGRPTPDDVSHPSGRAVHIVQPDPAIPTSAL